MAQFDSKDLTPGARFMVEVEVVEKRTPDDEKMAVFISYPDMMMETLFDVVSIEKIVT